MKHVFGALRAIVGLAGLIAIIATFFDTASRATINPFNFFGYFTMQSNVIFMIAMLATAAAIFAGPKQSQLLIMLRACATTYIVIVGIVYNLLLVGLEGGVTLQWANWVLHVALPIYAALDWVLFADRPALPWKRFWLVVIYPIVWVVVVLIRGATDGWVPYPFLDPTQGYGVVALYCIGIAVAVLVVGALVWAVSRTRIIKP